MGYNSAIISTQGQELLARAISGQTSIKISKVAISDKPYSEFNVKQELIPSIEITTDKKVLAKAVFSNVAVTEGYYIECIGIYAKDDSDNEVLFSYSEADDKPDYLDRYNGISPFTVSYSIYTGIIANDGIVVQINQDGIATQADLKNKLDKKEVDNASDLPFPDGTHSGQMYFIKNENRWVVEKLISPLHYGFETITYTDETTEPTPTLNAYYHNTTLDKWYKSVAKAQQKEVLDFEKVDTLPAKGSFVNGTYVVENLTNLYIADASEDSGYVAKTNFIVVDTEPTNPTDYTYYLVGGEILEFFSMYEWQEIEVNSVAELPTPSEETENKYYLVGTTLSLGVKIGATYKWDDFVVKSDLDKTTIVTIPSTGWTTNTDSGGKTYYTIDIDVEGMYADFVGTEDMQPVRPTPFNVTTWETIKEEFAKISNGGGADSHDGYITVYATEQLLQPVDCFIFGL